MMSDSHMFDASQLEIVKNILPDNSGDPNSWDLKGLAFLLAGFVEGSRGILNTKYLHVLRAVEVIQAHPELRDILVSAWDRKEYNTVLNLNILRAEPAVASAYDPIYPSELGISQKMGSLFAFTEPYQGVAVDGFYEYLEYNHRLYLNMGRTYTAEYYGKFCSVVQSSGTGKTRVILELAQKGVLVLYMNLRPHADRSGFPPRDNTPASILTGDCASAAQYAIQCCVFFSAIFQLIRDDLSERLEHDDGRTAVENWNKDMCKLGSSYRAQFFQRLQKTYEQIKHDSNFNRGADVELNLHYYKRLIEVLRSAFPNANIHHPKLVIALDEAHPLHERINFRRLTVLSQVISTYSAPRSPEAVWVVFVATTLKVADFGVSPRTFFSSAEASLRGELSFPPYCQLGWDQHALALGTVPPAEVAQFKHLLRYGRPLWMSLIYVFPPHAIFDFALRKLIGTISYEGLNDQHAALVVLAQRFSLNICFGHREAVRFVESTVAKHMRICIKTTEDCLWSYTTYPSEPLLSCAAASAMHQTEYSLIATLDTLNNKVVNGMIDAGQCGELVSRLLWLLAKDFFVIRNNPNLDIQGFIGNTDDADAVELAHCRRVPVVQFFEFVFGNDFWGKVKDRAGPDAREAFKDAYVNFSHWVSMESLMRRDDKMTKDQLDLNEFMMRHWQRTCAVQCCHDQPSINKVIPIYFKSAAPGPDGVDCMSQILISDKAHISKQHDALSRIQRSDSTIGGQENLSNPLPYIAIVADLYLKDTGLESVTFTQASTRTPSDAPSLRIHACGLGMKSYPFFKHYPKVLKALRDLFKLEMTPPKSNRPLADHMQDRAEYGKSGKGQHMEWERGSKLPGSLQG